MRRFLSTIALILCFASQSIGARLWATGFEQNTVIGNAEWTATGGSPTISSTTVRSGTYAGRVTSPTSGAFTGFRYRTHASSDLNGPYFWRTYINFATLPTAENTIISGLTSSTVRMVRITVDNGGLLRLYDEDGQIGSASSGLSTGTWYEVDLQIDRTPVAGSHIVKARLEESEFAGATNRNLSSGINEFRIGANINLEAQTTIDIFFDDVAINDNTGSFQNSYPGSGKIIHLRPNAAGDANSFATQTGGTAGSGNNYTRTNEITPNDATSFNGSNILNEEDLFNVDNSGIGASDTVNVVMVSGRFRNPTADATTAFKIECEKASAGTIAQSAAIIPNSTTWRNNASAEPRNYPLVLYQDPDSVNWTQTTLDSMQVGYKLTTGGTNRIDVTAVWALVDYTPGGAPPPSPKRLPLLGIGANRWRSEDYR